ncbi:MAG: AAA family ATPase [Bacilli bacterium]|nr:AAA family ATPase [Bacilli bacterium]
MSYEKQITLKDIGGYKEEKEEAARIIDFLKNYEEYTKKGAYLPKGILLLGTPGIGKTLFATAIANESGVPLITLNAEGQNLVGENLFNSINEVFQKAKKNVPCVLMLDEIGNFLPKNMGMGGSDRSTDILNLLLTTIDGLSNSEGILIVATANNSYEIDDALTRPGRLEKSIHLSMPTSEERAEICKLYLNKSELFSEVDPKELALRMGRMTGAMVKKVINEALIYAISNKDKKIHAEDFTPFIYSTVMNGVKKNNNEKDLDALAVHELGHFLCDYCLNGEVGDVSIEQFSSTAGSYRRLKEEERAVSSWSTIYKNIAVSLGGIAATEAILGEKHNGGSDDMRKAIFSVVAAAQSGLLGFNCLPKMRGALGEQYPTSPNFHPMLNAVLTGAYKSAYNVVRENKAFVEAVIDKLKTKKVILSKEMESLVNEHKVKTNMEMAKIKFPKGNAPMIVDDVRGSVFFSGTPEEINEIEEMINDMD